jgi:hypothetical protein
MNILVLGNKREVKRRFHPLEINQINTFLL